MANPELVDILKRGSDAWNDWREQQPKDLQIDLSEANLAKADLNGADLYHVDLTNANLNGAYLSEADLSKSYLNGAELHDARLYEAHLQNANLQNADLYDVRAGYANLQGASLFRAHMSGINLTNANLSNADLRNADLRNADLHGTNLHHANLDGARIWDTIFAMTDLREVVGLANVIHDGPSIVQINTIQLPSDGSALHFLRGTGVSDKWIDDYRAHMMYPIQYHSCFISYSHHDNAIARRLHSDLQDWGIRCWFAPHDMHIGDKIRSRIDEAIHLQDKLLLILSEHSVTSDWVEHEVETALARERLDKRTTIFPIRLDDAILARPHTGWATLVQNERHIGDFTGWKNHDGYQQAFQRLLRDLKAETQK